MKRLAIGIALILAVASSVFAQSDLQPLAVVKLNKQETITLKQLKNRAAFVEKQMSAVYGSAQTLTVEQRKQLLDTLIQEKLVAQAAAKAGVAITDSQVDAAFLSSFSQQLGRQVTEAQLSEEIKAQTGKTLSEYLQQSSGMSLAETKAYLKTQLMAQSYVYSLKQSEVQSVAATDKEIRDAYDMNKTQFLWDDMVKLFLVIVPKGNDAVAARATATDLRNQYVKDKSSEAAIKASENNGKTYQAGPYTVHKNSAQAQGWSNDKILELFGKNVGYISEVNETSTDFQFYAVQQKYGAKMLGLSDIVAPETNVTVYEYIKSNLTAQKQQQFFTQAAQDIAKSLDTPANVERKKTGEALNALLKW